MRRLLRAGRPKVGLTVDELQRMAGPEALIAVESAINPANVPMKQQIFYLRIDCE
ncbi:hypothetical protein ACVSD9_24675 (plasmid) [Vibrio parahaemolyticus]